MRAVPMPAGRFVLATLVTWRVTHLLAEEDGPADVVVRLRRRAGHSWVGDLLDCFYCLSVWVAVPFSVGLSSRRRADPLWCLAVSGAACLLEQGTRAAHGSREHGKISEESTVQEGTEG
jgi:Protein of unknown function (DUF1360)